MQRLESNVRQQKLSVKSMEAAMGIEKTTSVQVSTQRVKRFTPFIA
jgi:hypothetical protein